MQQKRITFISFDEFKKLYKAEKDKRYKLILLLAFGSGLRISEIVGYKREDGTFIPSLTKDMVDLQSHQIRLVGGKGNKWRTTITPPALTESMLQLLPLKNKKGEPLARTTVQDHIKTLCKKVLGKNMSIHVLRHGFGNYMVNDRQLPLPMVQQFMGHSRIDTTGIYTKANPEKAIAKAWEMMNE